jgi:hypothetical protein
MGKPVPSVVLTLTSIQFLKECVWNGREAGSPDFSNWLQIVSRTENQTAGEGRTQVLQAGQGGGRLTGF